LSDIFADVLGSQFQLEALEHRVYGLCHGASQPDAV